MGCGISKLERQQIYDNVKERGMHEYYSEEEDMKEKERSWVVEKVKDRRNKEQQQLAHARKEDRHGRDFDDDHHHHHEQMLSDSDSREDSAIYNCPRSPSFRDYCIDSDDSSTHHTVHTPYKFSINGDYDHIDHAANRTLQTWPEFWYTNKVQQETPEADDFVKKEGKGISPSRIKGVLSMGKQSRLRSYLNVSSWHHHNNPISSSQQNPAKLVAGS